jgi:hypothetical protein
VKFIGASLPSLLFLRIFQPRRHHSNTSSMPCTLSGHCMVHRDFQMANSKTRHCSRRRPTCSSCTMQSRAAGTHHNNRQRLAQRARHKSLVDHFPTTAAWCRQRTSRLRPLGSRRQIHARPAIQRGTQFPCRVVVLRLDEPERLSVRSETWGHRPGWEADLFLVH